MATAAREGKADEVIGPAADAFAAGPAACEGAGVGGREVEAGWGTEPAEGIAEGVEMPPGAIAEGEAEAVEPAPGACAAGPPPLAAPEEGIGATADEPPDPAVDDCGPGTVGAVPAEEVELAGAVSVCAAAFDGVVELPPPPLASVAALLAGFATGDGLAAGSTTDREDDAELLATAEPP
jgi:hypothetical protein